MTNSIQIMSGTLEGKVALVTGAGRGIGRAIAHKFAAHGAQVVINDLDADTAQQVVDEIHTAGGTAVACSGNVSNVDFADQFINTALREYQGIDIIVNNAGYTWDSVIQQMTDEQWYTILNVHLTAPFHILRAAQPAIRTLINAERAAGITKSRRVVNISSVAGIFGSAGQVNYAVAKAGIEGLTKTLAKEWGRHNITVNCVAYGYIKTRLTESYTNEDIVAHIDGRDIRVGVNSATKLAIEQAIPLKRGGTPEEAAGAVYLFCLPEADYISGQTLMCTGGLTGI